MKLTAPGIIKIVIISSITCLLSCSNNTSNEPAEVVYYYPQKNVYYDSLRSNFYYSLDGAITWDSLEFRGASFGNVLGPRSAIPRTDDSIWLDNALHRRQYNGVLVNVINKYTIALAKADRLNRLKAVVKAETQSPATVEKKEAPVEKGLKKLFNKIFRKKKKPAADKEP
jgi:hypothetical protein